MLYCVSRPRRLHGRDGNAWWAGFWPAGRMLDTRFKPLRAWNGLVIFFCTGSREIAHTTNKKSMQGVHFTILPASPCLAEFYKIWHTRSSHWRNRPRQILSQLAQLLRSSETPELPFPINLVTPLQQCTHCRATLWWVAAIVVGQQQLTN